MWDTLCVRAGCDETRQCTTKRVRWTDRQEEGVDLGAAQVSGGTCIDGFSCVFILFEAV